MVGSPHRLPRRSLVQRAEALHLREEQSPDKFWQPTSSVLAEADGNPRRADDQAEEPLHPATVQDDSALLIQYRYLRSLPPVVTVAPGAAAPRGDGVGDSTVGRTLPAGSGFNLARAIRQRSLLDSDAAGTPTASSAGALDSSARSGSVSPAPSQGTDVVVDPFSPKTPPVDPTTLLCGVANIVVAYEGHGQPLLAMMALQLGEELCIDLARERRREAARARRASAGAGNDRAELLFSDGGGGGNDRAELLFSGGGGGNDRAELLFGGGGSDRAELLFGGGGGSDRAELLFGGGGNDRAELLFGGGGSSTSYGGDRAENLFSSGTIAFL